HQAYVYTPAGLYAGYVNVWGDWAAHLSFTGSFAYGHNFPPEYPVDPGHRLGYPFMIDFLAAQLVPVGLSLTEAVTATSGMLGLVFPAVLYLAALRFTAGRAASAIAVFVFLLSGGLGFVHFFADVLRGGLGVIAHLPREYTLNRDLNLQWLNPVLAYLVPQRSTLFGFSLALILLLVLWIALRQGLGWRPFLFAGHALVRWFPTAFPTWFAPMWLWFVVPNVIVLQPWVWDNTKFFVFWALLGSVVAAGVLAGMLMRGPATAIVAVTVMVLLGLSGALDLARASDFSKSNVQFTDAGGLKVADWVRHNTSPTTIFAFADEPNSPIPCLAGHRELVGYPGWLWTYGLADYVQKIDDDNKILKGDP